MRTLAVLPVKSFDSAKQRLSDALGGGSRQLLAQAMFGDVLGAMRRARHVEAIAVVTDDHEAEALLRGQRATVLADDRRAGQSAAAQIGIQHALREGFRRVLLVPGDTPLVEGHAIDRLLEASQAERLEVTIVPDRHRTGTNALVLCPPDVMAPSFGPDSLERHVRAAREGGLSHRLEEVGSLMHDVDSPEDLVELSAIVERSHGVAPRTRGALRQLDRLQTHAASAGRRRAAEAERGKRGGRLVRVMGRPGDGEDSVPGEKMGASEEAGVSEPNVAAAGRDSVVSGDGDAVPEEEGAPSADERPAWARAS